MGRYPAELGLSIILPLLAGCASITEPTAAGEVQSVDRPALQNFTQRIEGTAIELEMIAVPGTPDEWAEEGAIKSFYISKTEIPWELYDLFVYPELDHAALKVKEGEAGDEDPLIDAIARPSKPYVPPDRGFGHAGYPAISMTHHAATEFCKWLSARTGRTYRLPTRAEWQAACVGKWIRFDLWANDSERGRPWYATWISRFAWNDGNSDWKTHPTASKEPNELGIYDTLGNAAEWIADDQDGDGLHEVVGGHFLTPPEEISFDWIEEQPSAWNASDPQIPKSKWWLPDAPFVGFRVVCEVEQEQDSPQRHGEED